MARPDVEGSTRREAPASDDSPKLPLPFPEFITLMALLMSLTAMSIDIMLPSLPDIGSALNVASPGDLPLIVSAYMGGLAIGQLFWGPVADRLGRRPPLLAGLAVFAIASTAAILSPNFAFLIAARVLQGFGGAAARIVAMAIVRDLFSGRQMARVMSIVMMVFILVPILAPTIGQGIILFGTWRWVFIVLLAAAVIGFVWSAVRLPETQAPEAPGSRPHSLVSAFRLVIGTRVTRGYGIASGFMFGCLVSYIASAQQVFVDAYGLGKLFPIAFGGVACFMAAASFTNSRLVAKLGMRRLSHTALVALIAISSTMATIAATVGLSVYGAFGAISACFLLYGLILSNFNAIAMQPVGEVAGMAASVIGSFTTAAGALFGTIVARLFDGTVVPLLTGFALLSFCALITVLIIEGTGGMFQGE